MLVGAGFTLFRMRKSLAVGIRRAVADLKKTAAHTEAAADRTQHDLSAKTVFIGIVIVAICMVALYSYFPAACSEDSSREA